MQIELEPKRIMIGDTDTGKKLLQMIADLKRLLAAYRQGYILNTTAANGKKSLPVENGRLFCTNCQEKVIKTTNNYERKVYTDKRKEQLFLYRR